MSTTISNNVASSTNMDLEGNYDHTNDSHEKGNKEENKEEQENEDAENHDEDSGDSTESDEGSGGSTDSDADPGPYADCSPCSLEGKYPSFNYSNMDPDHINSLREFGYAVVPFWNKKDKKNQWRLFVHPQRKVFCGACHAPHKPNEYTEGIAVSTLGNSHQSECGVLGAKKAAAKDAYMETETGETADDVRLGVAEVFTDKAKAKKKLERKARRAAKKEEKRTMTSMLGTLCDQVSQLTTNMDRVNANMNAVNAHMAQYGFEPQNLPHLAASGANTRSKMRTTRTQKNVI